MIDQDMFANEIYLLDKGVRSCFSDILFIVGVVVI